MRHPVDRNTFDYTDPFGSTLGRSYAHTGSDYAVAFAEVYAVDVMDIVATGYNAGNGNYITAYLPTHDHDGYDGGIYIAFIHLSSINVGVGDRVQPGTKIGVSGNSGYNSRGPHLHVTMGVNSDQVHLGIGHPLIDPFAYIDARPDSPTPPPTPTPTPTRTKVIDRLKKLIAEAKKNLRDEKKKGVYADDRKIAKYREQIARNETRLKNYRRNGR